MLVALEHNELDNAQTGVLEQCQHREVAARSIFLLGVFFAGPSGIAAFSIEQDDALFRVFKKGTHVK